MTLLAFLGLFPALFGMAAQPQGQPAEAQGVRRTVIHEELIISIPLRPRPRQRIEWIEQKGPKCIPVKRLAGESRSDPRSLNRRQHGDRRERTRLDATVRQLQA